MGTRLGRHGINIANFSLGRTAGGMAAGVLNVDAAGAAAGAAVTEHDLRDVRFVERVRAVDLSEVG